MSIFSFNENTKLGTILSVDTSNITVRVTNPELMKKISIGHVISIEGNYTYEKLICIVDKVSRAFKELDDIDDSVNDSMEFNYDLIKGSLIGTYKSADGIDRNIFKRGVNSFPNIDSEANLICDDNLEKFMGILGKDIPEEIQLFIGNFTNNTNSKAILDGDKLFQRHASVLGSTGSGKSWCVATIIECASKLSFPNIIVFDLHGEYTSLTLGENRIAEKYKIAGAGDLNKEDDKLIFLPYWLLNREEILSTILDRSDSNAPNQSSRFTAHLSELKMQTLEEENEDIIKNSFTVDSPIPYDLLSLIDKLKNDDKAMKIGANSKPVKGDWNGKLTRFIARLETKISDKRYSFLYNPKAECNNYDWINNFITNLIGSNEGNKGIKIIDFSEVPSDILPIVTGTIARILYDVQFWMESEERSPFTLLCDEAHLYLPVKEDADAAQKQALYNFERIAKEGRKYGVSLFVVSQRPSDVSKTILSQCNNFIVLRLTNDRDQSVIKNLVPDSLRGIMESLPILGVGEAIVLGDSILLPNRIQLMEPSIKPNSNTIEFWKEWGNKKPENQSIIKAVQNLRAQSKL